MAETTEVAIGWLDRAGKHPHANDAVYGGDGFIVPSAVAAPPLSSPSIVITAANDEEETSVVPYNNDTAAAALAMSREEDAEAIAWSKLMQQTNK